MMKIGKQIRFSVFLCVGMLSIGHAEVSAVKLTQLSCEHLENPLGIDVRVPRLSWQMASEERGQKQTAYRVIVARSPKALEQNSGTLWVSGKVDADPSFLVSYGGTVLSSHDDCYWKVMVWDSEGAPSAWSPTARFSMGLLKESDWSGSWIHSSTAKPEEHVWFIKGIGGIQSNPENPGMKQFIIKPHLVGDLSYAAAESPSPYGLIKSAWKRDKNTLTLDVTVPPNSEATVYIPSSDVQKITEGGVPIRKIEGVTFLRQEADRSVVQLQSGTFAFVVVLQ